MCITQGTAHHRWREENRTARPSSFTVYVVLAMLSYTALDSITIRMKSVPGQFEPSTGDTYESDHAEACHPKIKSKRYIALGYSESRALMEE